MIDEIQQYCEVPRIKRPVPQFMSYPSADECCQSLISNFPREHRRSLRLHKHSQILRNSGTMKLLTPQVFCLGATMLPLAATSPDSAVAAISDRRVSRKFMFTELAKVERSTDNLARQAQGSVVCTLTSFHLGQSCRELLPAFFSYIFLTALLQKELPVSWPLMSCTSFVLSSQ